MESSPARFPPAVTRKTKSPHTHHKDPEDHLWRMSLPWTDRPQAWPQLPKRHWDLPAYSVPPRTPYLGTGTKEMSGNSVVKKIGMRNDMRQRGSYDEKPEVNYDDIHGAQQPTVEEEHSTTSREGHRINSNLHPDFSLDDRSELRRRISSDVHPGIERYASYESNVNTKQRMSDDTVSASSQDAGHNSSSNVREGTSLEANHVTRMNSALTTYSQANLKTNTAEKASGTSSSKRIRTNPAQSSSKRTQTGSGDLSAGADQDCRSVTNSDARQRTINGTDTRNSDEDRLTTNSVTWLTTSGTDNPCFETRSEAIQTTSADEIQRTYNPVCFETSIGAKQATHSGTHPGTNCQHKLRTSKEARTTTTRDVSPQTSHHRNLVIRRSSPKTNANISQGKNYDRRPITSNKASQANMRNVRLETSSQQRQRLSTKEKGEIDYNRTAVTSRETNPRLPASTDDNGENSCLPLSALIRAVYRKTTDRSSGLGQKDKKKDKETTRKPTEDFRCSTTSAATSPTRPVMLPRSMSLSVSPPRVAHAASEDWSVQCNETGLVGGGEESSAPATLRRMDKYVMNLIHKPRPYKWRQGSYSPRKSRRKEYPLGTVQPGSPGPCTGPQVSFSTRKSAAKNHRFARVRTRGHPQCECRQDSCPKNKGSPEGHTCPGPHEGARVKSHIKSKSTLVHRVFNTVRHRSPGCLGEAGTVAPAQTRRTRARSVLSCFCQMTSLSAVEEEENSSAQYVQQGSPQALEGPDTQRERINDEEVSSVNDSDTPHTSLHRNRNRRGTASSAGSEYFSCVDDLQSSSDYADVDDDNDYGNEYGNHLSQPSSAYEASSDTTHQSLLQATAPVTYRSSDTLLTRLQTTPTHTDTGVQSSSDSDALDISFQLAPQSSALVACTSAAGASDTKLQTTSEAAAPGFEASPPRSLVISEPGACRVKLTKSSNGGHCYRFFLTEGKKGSFSIAVGNDRPLSIQVGQDGSFSIAFNNHRSLENSFSSERAFPTCVSNDRVVSVNVVRTFSVAVGSDRSSPITVGRDRSSPITVGRDRSSPITVGRDRSSPITVSRDRSSPTSVGNDQAISLTAGWNTDDEKSKMTTAVTLNSSSYELALGKTELPAGTIEAVSSLPSPDSPPHKPFERPEMASNFTKKDSLQTSSCLKDRESKLPQPVSSHTPCKGPVCCYMETDFPTYSTEAYSALTVWESPAEKNCPPGEETEHITSPPIFSKEQEVVRSELLHGPQVNTELQSSPDWAHFTNEQQRSPLKKRTLALEPHISQRKVTFVNQH